MIDPADFRSLRWTADGPVCLVMLDRPDVLNALNVELKEELRAAIELAAERPDVRAVVLTGSGRGFCAGQDLEEVAAGDEPLDFEREVREHYIPLVLAIRDLEKPVVAAVNGVAAGAGFSLALACDIRIAAETASFVAAFNAVALVPDTGMSWLLPRLVGPGRAAEILLGGGRVSAAEAERIGLVNRVVPAADLLAEATALARRLAEGSPLASGLTKRALNVALETGFGETLDLEARHMGIAGRSADHREGLAAFREKRRPRFEGR